MSGWSWLLGLFLINSSLFASPTTLPFESNREVQKVVELTNAQRAAYGLPPLKLQGALCAAAFWMAQDMAAHHHCSHTDSRGRRLAERIPLFGYVNYQIIGENLAAGLTTPEEVVAAWMQSPAHRENLLNPNFREIGIGFSESDTGRYYWVQELGARYEVQPLIINGEAAKTGSPLVHLYIYGEDWARQMRFSQDGEHWTEWEPYQPHRSWNLPPQDGRHTLYVELRNGSTTQVASDSIELVMDRQKVAITLPRSITQLAP